MKAISQFEIILKRFPCLETWDCKILFQEISNEEQLELIKELSQTDGFFHSIRFIEPDEYTMAFVSWDKLWGPYSIN